jgi:hypothetical protein
LNVIEFDMPEEAGFVEAEWPDAGWIEKRSLTSIKRRQADDSLFGPLTLAVVEQLNSEGFREWLAKRLNVAPLIADPYLKGGLLAEIPRGGYLKIHTDFNWHGQLDKKRAVNLLLYLNRDWEEAYGGHLEFWDKDVRRCVKKILPTFGKAVAFECTAVSWHGHPDPLRCPLGRQRRSLAVYYYADAPRERPHSTIYRERPGEVFCSPPS